MAVAIIVQVLKNMYKFYHNVATILKRKRRLIENVFGKFTVLAIFKRYKLREWSLWVVCPSLVHRLVKS